MNTQSNKRPKELVLITGFEPFLDHESNISGSLAQCSATLLAKTQDEFDVDSVVLPVTFDVHERVLRQEISAKNPRLLVMMGLASGRQKIGIEKVGMNIADSRHPDGRGEIRTARPLRSSEPFTIQNPLPLHQLIEGLPADRFEVSWHAATYVCNALYFEVLASWPKLSCVFLHLPADAKPSEVLMLLERILAIVKDPSR